MLVRFVCYGILGWCVEIVYTAIQRVLARERGRWRLEGRTYVWMFPIYGLIAPLYEPLHNGLRNNTPWELRAVIYGIAIMAVEYVTGWILRRVTGACPWDYAGRARFHVHGLIRLDYLPLWMALGLALEPIHDFLVHLTPAIKALL